MAVIVADPAERQGLAKPGRVTTALVGPHPFPEQSAGVVGREELQVFLVDVEPASPPIATHFHPVNQFQVFLRGDGKLGRHGVGRGYVHYADAHTPYGPLVAGPSGFAYLAFRSVSDAGAFWMPADRHELAQQLTSAPRAASARRNVSIDVDPGPPADGADPTTSVVRSDPDGLRIAVSHIAAGSEWCPRPIAGAGALVLVLAGGVTAGDVRLGPDGFVAGTAGEPLPRFVDSGTGTTVLTLELPRPPRAAQPA